jgi:hypothetical protein
MSSFQQKNMKRGLLILILIIGLALRLYKVNDPIADWHSFRQADTASVTRNIVNKTGSFFVPTYHDLSDIQSGKTNPKGYRMVELPIYNSISAYFSRFSNVELASRFVSIFFSLASALIIYLYCLRLTSNFWPSFLAMSTFLLLPFNIFYSRTILPEPSAVFFMLLSLYLFPKQYFFSAVSLSLAILIKPFTAIIIFPVLLLQVFQLKYWQIAIFSITTISPFFAWRIWIKNFPEGIPASSWLINGGNIRFRPAWFRWLFLERIGKLILGTYGLIPFYLGLAYKKNKTQSISIALMIGILLYFSIIARGNIQHDYYQTLIIPSISIVTGFGIYYMFKFLFPRSPIYLFANLLICFFALTFSAYKVIEYYKINNPIIIEAGKIADKILPPNATVIAPYNGDTAFLYQTNRKGYPIELYGELPKIKDFYLISINNDKYRNDMIKLYPIVYNSNNIIILNLNHVQ